jgi:hypothetical protein
MTNGRPSPINQTTPRTIPLLKMPYTIHFEKFAMDHGKAKVSRFQKENKRFTEST